jgi:hypothetical protein
MKFRKENWEITRKKGFLHFFLFRGILLFGLPLTLFQFVLRLNVGNKIDFIDLFISGLFGAFIYSGSMWYFAERRYKKENFKDKV